MQKIEPTQNRAVTARCPFCEKVGAEVFDQSGKRIVHKTCLHWRVIGNSGRVIFISDEELQHYRRFGQAIKVRSDGSISVDGKLVHPSDE